jgi:hypothetical protein
MSGQRKMQMLYLGVAVVAAAFVLMFVLALVKGVPVPFDRFCTALEWLVGLAVAGNVGEHLAARGSAK